MRLLTVSEATHWCQEHGLTVQRSHGTIDIGWPTISARSVEAVVAGSPGRLVAMAQATLLADLTDPDVSDFGGALIWISEWGIWNEDSERAGMRSLELMRTALAHEARGSVREFPAQLFSAVEFVDAHALLGLPLLYQWDAYVVPSSGRCVARICHDGTVSVQARADVVVNRIHARFDAARWLRKDATG